MKCENGHTVGSIAIDRKSSNYMYGAGSCIHFIRDSKEKRKPELLGWYSPCAMCSHSVSSVQRHSWWEEEEERNVHLRRIRKMCKQLPLCDNRNNREGHCQIIGNPPKIFKKSKNIHQENWARSWTERIESWRKGRIVGRRMIGQRPQLQRAPEDTKDKCRSK